MFKGFEKIIEERIRKAQLNGEFDNLPGSGKPLAPDDDRLVSEELRLAYKILKNADCTPPEIELKKEIRQTEELLSGMADTAEKYRVIKKLNFMILKLNTLRKTSIPFEAPQQYHDRLIENLESKSTSPAENKNSH